MTASQAPVSAQDPESWVHEEHYPNRREHWADWWVHMIGLVAALAGGGFIFGLGLSTGNISRATATALYAVCLVAMLAASAAYNFARPHPRRRVLRRLDEAAIFLMIAGSYTPFTVTHFEGWAAVGVTGLVWVVGLAGVIGKIFVPNISDKVWCGVYVGFGWLAAFIMPPIAGAMPVAAMTLLALGGIIYTAGVPFFLRKTLPFRRAIWHGFVVAGASLHYAAILLGVGLIAS